MARRVGRLFQNCDFPKRKGSSLFRDCFAAEQRLLARSGDYYILHHFPAYAKMLVYDELRRTHWKVG
jgi:hypothetical protein